ncbi:MAG: MarR family transcriptional regulator [Candidatus Eremiobacteraeota bacterium]|nr:MarR family transcriptional regulator [Candidatus Eremiobacteraeota bacterium]
MDLAGLAMELQLLNGKLRRRLRAQATIGDLTPSQIAVLVYLERNPEGSTVTELAQAEGVRSQSMGSTVASLQSIGLLRGESDPKDGRKTLLFLTEACRHKLAQGRSLRRDWLVHAMEAHLSEVEIDQLAAAIELLKKVVDHDP